MQTESAGIKRAHAVVGLHPEHPCVPTPGAVTVYVVPGLPSSLRRFRERTCGDNLVALKPDEGALRAIAQRLDETRLLTQELFVEPAKYEPVRLAVVVSGATDNEEWISKSIQNRLHDYLHPLFGGPNGDGWPFGDPLLPSELIRVVRELIEAELRVDSIAISRLDPSVQSQESATIQNPESCSGVAIQSYSLVELRDVAVSFVRSRTEVGGLL